MGPRVGIGERIAHTGSESSQKLGKHRWFIEWTIAWMFDYCRLSIRYERTYANRFGGFLALAAALTSFKKLTNTIGQPTKTCS